MATALSSLNPPLTDAQRVRVSELLATTRKKCAARRHDAKRRMQGLDVLPLEWRALAHEYDNIVWLTWAWRKGTPVAAARTYLERATIAYQARQHHRSNDARYRARKKAQ